MEFPLDNSTDNITAASSSHYADYNNNNLETATAQTSAANGGGHGSIWCWPYGIRAANETATNRQQLFSVLCDTFDQFNNVDGDGDDDDGSIINASEQKVAAAENLFTSVIKQFKCDLINTNYNFDDETNQANYECSSEPLKYNNNCVHYLKVNVANVINPIAEFILNIPKSITTSLQYHLDPADKSNNFTLNNNNQISDNQSFCDKLIYQVFQCNGVFSNYTFYENDTLNYYYGQQYTQNTTTSTTAWPERPIQCFLGGADGGGGGGSSSNVNGTEIAAIATTFVTHFGRQQFEWSFLFVIFFILAGGLGNILVCLAICLDKKLQNVTNYFLLSLAIADLLVCLFVMPLGAVPGFLGYWPFGLTWCNVYLTFDVLACSASILHMCFISLGRYLGIRNPLGSRHHSTKRLTSIKIALVWLSACFVSSSITVLGIWDKTNIMPQKNVCTINNRAFFVFGSLVTFYIPMFTMVVTYALTVRLLRKKALFAVEHESDFFRRLGGRYPQKSSTTTFNSHNSSIRSTICTVNSSTSSRITQSASQYSIVPLRSQGNNNMERSSISMSASHPHLSFNSGSRHTLKCDQETQTSSRKKSQKRNSSVPSSTSNQHLSYYNGSRSGMRRTRTCDQQTQTPINIEKETRPQKSRTFRLNFNNTPPFNLNLRFLRSRRKAGLTANAVATEQKATKVLGVVFFMFVFCWAPFFILNIVMAVCVDCIIPDHVAILCLWLGYISSTINPIIYTIFNKTFRNQFRRLLLCKCEKTGWHTRYRSVNEGRGTASLFAPSTLPLAISLQGAPLLSSSTTHETPLCEFRSNYDDDD